MKISTALFFFSIVLTHVSALSRRAAAAAGDPQTSPTLSPSVVAEGFKSDGNPTAGEIASLTSSNNFINFCLGKQLTNGKQVTSGSCNPAPMGDLPSVDNMPSAKFTNPPNGGTVPANQAFSITMAINNLATGNFVNAQASYFAAPQTISSGGPIIGHSHVVVEALSALDQTSPTDPRKFAFFKGLDDAAQGGVLTAAVAGGLPAGPYRLCSINTAANHQPVLVPIAQHGSLDDCVYFTATDNGAAAANTGAAAASTGNGNAATATATGAAGAAATGNSKASATNNTTATPSPTPTGAAATGKAKGNKGGSRTGGNAQR